MLGEASTTEITREKDIKGFAPNLIAAKLGGEVAGKARKDLERKTGKKIVTKKRPIDNQDQIEENQEETVEGIIA
jgi:hypothetical protein